MVCHDRRKFKRRFFLVKKANLLDYFTRKLNCREPVISLISGVGSISLLQFGDLFFIIFYFLYHRWKIAWLIFCITLYVDMSIEFLLFQFSKYSGEINNAGSCWHIFQF